MHGNPALLDRESRHNLVLFPEHLCSARGAAHDPVEFAALTTDP